MSAERSSIAQNAPTSEELCRRLHILLAEALRCMDDGRIDAVRRKVAYTDVLVCELEAQLQGTAAALEEALAALASSGDPGPATKE